MLIDSEGSLDQLLFAPRIRGHLEAQIEHLKERLLCPVVQSVTNPELAKKLAWAANEAAALAWFTVCPILVLPVLLEEKIQEALKHWQKQEQLRLRAQRSNSAEVGSRGRARTLRASKSEDILTDFRRKSKLITHYLPSAANKHSVFSSGAFSGGDSQLEDDIGLNREKPLILLVSIEVGAGESNPRFYGLQPFGQHPERLLGWFAKHM